MATPGNTLYYGDNLDILRRHIDAESVDLVYLDPPFEFENWAVIALGGIPNKVQVGDMGVDGRIYPVGTKPADHGGMFAEDWFPIQVKQSDEVGRPDTDAFEAVMEREGEGGRQRGFFVAFGYTRDAEQECTAFHKRTTQITKMLTVQEILDAEHVQKM